MTENQPADDLVPCRYCGRMTSPAANFCYYCARELKARPEHPLEESPRRKVNWVALGVIAAIILFILIYSLVH